jgi:hypothetical protein
MYLRGNFFIQMPRRAQQKLFNDRSKKRPFHLRSCLQMVVFGYSFHGHINTPFCHVIYVRVLRIFTLVPPSPGAFRLANFNEEWRSLLIFFQWPSK